jgi:D-serine deaminase-like pyridoxal phosphate-dependent protein
MDTPAVTVDLKTVRRNIERLQRLADQCGVKVRPHIKTHKSVYFAKMQLLAGARGITAAKLGEAEVMAKAGITDILLAYPILGKAKLERLKQLLQYAEVTVSLDNETVAAGLSELGESLKRKIRVYLEIDTGLRRTGFQSVQDALAFAKSIRPLPGIRITGLLSHGGHCYGIKTREQLRKIAVEEAKMMNAVKEALDRAGIPIEEVSVGASPAMPFLKEMEGVTEIRPGTYIFNDYNQLCLRSAIEEECAVRIVSTVVSRPAADRIIIDAGSKTLTSDLNVTGKGYGYIVGHPDYRIERLSEEHGILSIPPDSDVRIGDTLTIIPNHVCPVINLADELIAMENGVLRERIPVDARGKNH